MTDCLHCAIRDTIEQFEGDHGQDPLYVLRALVDVALDVLDGAPSEEIRHMIETDMVKVLMERRARTGHA